MDKYVLRVGDTVFPVTEKEYHEYYRELERWKYIKKAEQGRKLSFEQAVADNIPLDTITCTDDCFTEERAIANIMIAQLRDVLLHLKDSERHLIELLFFQEHTTREAANLLGIDQSTVVRNKVRILAKIKKLMRV